MNEEATIAGNVNISYDFIKLHLLIFIECLLGKQDWRGDGGNIFSGRGKKYHRVKKKTPPPQKKNVVKKVKKSVETNIEKGYVGGGQTESGIKPLSRFGGG